MRIPAAVIDLLAKTIARIAHRGLEVVKEITIRGNSSDNGRLLLQVDGVGRNRHSKNKGKRVDKEIRVTKGSGCVINVQSMLLSVKGYGALIPRQEPVRVL